MDGLGKRATRSALHIARALVFSYFLLPGSDVVTGNLEPRDNSDEGFVVFRGAPCKKAPKLQLLNQMGIDFDVKRMGFDGSSSKRLKNPEQIRPSIYDLFRSMSKPSEKEQRESLKNDWLKVGPNYEDYDWLMEDLPAEGQNIHSTTWPFLNKHRKLPSFSEKDVFTEEKRTGSEAQDNPGRLPWKCSMEQQWQRMPEGIFPPYIQTGRCTQTTCMLDTYACTPVKYVLKVLRRNPQICNPVPMIGNETIYEEVWNFSRIKVTVYCECSRLRPGFSSAAFI